MWPNLQETADFATFIEEIFNGKLHFFCAVSILLMEKKYLSKLKEQKTIYLLHLGFFIDIYCLWFWTFPKLVEFQPIAGLMALFGLFC